MKILYDKAPAAFSDKSGYIPKIIYIVSNEFFGCFACMACGTSRRKASRYPKNLRDESFANGTVSLDVPLYFSCRFITYNKAHFQLRKGVPRHFKWVA
ncbi:hypothetical protein Atc_1811 [Acidithiobacillus caldus SM-1]|uniref:Uncharacterized protein n=1 Tax=Acidithiobacillus caldus (strain SM-1) TaxID=990288 RepID=F9ZP47_ACICS|nr:hypothetical protein Atc_1811 [Acidithiobacillus caldus SM-1]